MLLRQAAEYQSWEDWVIQNDMGKSGNLGPGRRKRKVLDVEMHGGSMEGPRWVRQQRIVMPEQGEVNIRLAASVVEEVPESEIETVVADIPQNQGTAQGALQVSEEMDFDQFVTHYEAWRSGELPEQEVLRRFGRDVLTMMQAQRVVGGATNGRGRLRATNGSNAG